MDIQKFWQYEPQVIMTELQTSPAGLSQAEASKRLAAGTNEKKERPRFLQDVILFLSQFKSPLTLLLVAAVILSAFLGETSDSFIILFILLATGIVSFIQERHAGKAVEKLKSIIRTKVKVYRNAVVVEVYTEEITAGDILEFSAGDIIPADCLLIEEKDIHVNEATLTGETYPAEKEIGVVPADTGLSKRTNVLFEGTSIVSGSGKAVAVLTGKDTVFGNISASIARPADETAFEKGIRKFGFLLMQITIVLAVIILTVNIYLGRPLIDSLLFGLALAVGMAPELLPAIMTIAMSSGAKRMAQQKVIVKKLSSIQNLGEINLFCSDKTGTLTEGVLEVSSIINIDGKEDGRVRQLAFLNASFESGFANPIDGALKNMKNISTDGYVKTDEIPYDFIRKCLSVYVEKNNQHQLITKGAVDNIVAICDKVMMPDGNIAPLSADSKNKIAALYLQYSNKGFRTIGVCYKLIDKGKSPAKDDERQMVFAGFVLLFDPPKEGVIEVISQLKRNGVELKIITGDNKLVAAYLAEKIGLHNAVVISGSEINKMSPEALVLKVQTAQVFAEIEPQQKESIVKALRKAGNAVAYMGDGINDVAAINAADVGISTNNAVDVAKEAADVVLLEKDLAVLNAGIIEGRRTFLNTLKYIYTNTSATFGNMFSMAGASLILPFLPMLPQQILMTNFLTDFPYMAIAKDNADEADLAVPQKWNIRQLKNFLIVFGLHSSVFDYLTFFALYKLYKSADMFHTGWFIESICTELLILFVVRTHKSLLKSMPGKLLIGLSMLSLVITVILPFTPFAAQLGFVVPPLQLLGIIAGILVLYVLTADIIKVMFFRKTAI